MTFVFVSGPPCAGKTTVARHLAQHLRLPLIAKDDIKESLADSFGTYDLASSKRLGAATWDLMFALMERFASAGASAIFESNFYPGLQRERIAGLCDAHRVEIAEVHCTADAGVLALRDRERPRHEVHHSLGSPEEWIAANGALQLSEVCFRVDTTEPERVDLDGIATAVGEVIGGL